MSDWPYRLERKYSNGCEACPEIWLGRKWVATVVGAPYLGHDSLEVGRRIVAALNATKHLTTDELERGVVDLAMREMGERAAAEGGHA